MNISIYSNANSATKTITVDFVGDYLAADDAGPFVANTVSMEYYVKFTTSVTQNNGIAYPVKIARKLSDLALNKTKQSQVDTGNAYGSIKEMVVDYVGDYITGHTANQFTSGCSEQKPLKLN